MTAYKDMTLDQRMAEYAALETVFEGLKAQGLKLDMTRGKPCKAQLDMVSDIFDTLNKPEDFMVDGIDIRNYGALSGLPEAKRLFANILDCKPKRQLQPAADVRRHRQRLYPRPPPQPPPLVQGAHCQMAVPRSRL